MQKSPHKIIENIITSTFSLWVKPDVLPVEPQGLLNPDLPVLYVLEKGGLADRATLIIACRQLGLPAPTNPLNYAHISESSSVDSLRRRRGIIFRRRRLVSSERVSRLINARLNDVNHSELQIVPVAVYWGRAPNKERSVWSLFFSENWGIAGRARTLITTLVYGRDTLLSFSEPLSLNTFLNTTEHAGSIPSAEANFTSTYGNTSVTAHANTSASKPSTTPEILVRKLSRILRVHFRQRRIASLGPDQSHRRMLVSHVLADPGVRAVIKSEASENNKKPERVQVRANKYALEIAADVSYPTVRVLHRLMSRLWTELYDGVELSGIDRLKAAADGKELVYVPCHRSHIDYLLLSYILYINGFSLPHIAAGINLNLPVVGGLLRRGGAFFLRRSFSGNKLYASVFNAYLTELLQRGHALEYFVEGGRSRTGRSLPPKGGMLAMTAHAYLRNPRTPVLFIPVYFGYERLLEGRAFTSELAGGKKQKESILALLKSLKTLREEYGNVHVNFGQPIDLDSLLDKHQAQWRSESIELDRPEWLNPVIDELGTNIMQNINDAACVTPISLLSLGLLATREGKLSEPELIDQMCVYHSLFSAAAQNTTAVVPSIDFSTAIDHGIKLGFISTSEDALGTLVSIKPNMAAPLTYFRNNIQHLITVPSLVACCFTSAPTQTKEQLRHLVNYAYPFLQNELFLTPQPVEATLNDAISSLLQSELLHIENNDGDQKAYRRASRGTIQATTLMHLAESVMPSLERYFLAAAIILQCQEKGIQVATLAERCEACANRLALTQGRDPADLYDKHLHNAMTDTLVQSNYITIDNDHISATEQFLTLATDTRGLVSEQMRQAVLQAVGQFN